MICIVILRDNVASVKTNTFLWIKLINVFLIQILITVVSIIQMEHALSVFKGLWLILLESVRNHS